ncbi:carboxypeptidase N subunit 2-like [Cryptotermes secundus]|uniref:carboxypeptidase N subunit 2-like n=1 Tax=Cryptotermes secundus TaxID=105785 RepID=UPI000CD7B125|nr:carboxypeptidase N subunit 2-like [Cryptotermes secundus]
MVKKQTTRLPGWGLVVLFLYFAGLCCGCPKPCECYEDWDRSITANCTSKHLTELPEPEVDIARFYISHNDIETLKGFWHSSAFPELKEFWADAARIQYIKVGAFSYMTKLSKLSLRYNLIENLQLEVFQGLESLEELRLEGNRLQEVNANVFTHLKKLEELYLDNNLIEIVEFGAFDGLDSLKILSLGKNFIARLASNTFHGLISLKDLRLHRNYLRILDQKLFHDLKNLTNLKLNDNEIEKMVSNIFSDLQSLVRLNINGNCLRKFQHHYVGKVAVKNNQSQPHMFAALSNLVYLHASDNLLEELDSFLFKDLVRLKFLDLSRNRLRSLHEDTFIYNKLLTDLLLSNNPRLVIPKNTSFIKVNSLKKLYLSSCGIADISERSFEYLPNLQDVRLDRNSLKTLKVEVLMGLRRLEKLSLYGNPLECDCALKKTWQWCHNKPIHLVHRTPFCIQPKNELGRSWNMLQSMQCFNYFSGGEFFKIFCSFVEPLVFAIILLSGATGTGALFLTFASYEKILETPSACIFSIAVADFLMIMVFLPMSFISAFTQMWKFGLPLCKIFMFTRDLIIGVTVFSVIVFGYHIYTWRTHCFRAHNYGFGSTSKAAILHLVGIWFVSTTLAFPALLSASNDYDKCIYAPISYGFYYIPCVTLVQLFIYSILPLFFMVLVYTITQRRILVKSQKVAGKISEDKQITRKQLSKIVVSLTSVLIISYAPNMIMRILVSLYLVNQNSDITKIFVFLTDCLFYSNTWLNPLVLYYTCNTYKRDFQRIIHCERFRKKFLKQEDTLSHATVSDQKSSVSEIRY